MYQALERERKLNIRDLWFIFKKSMSKVAAIYITLLFLVAVGEVFFGKYIGEFPSKMYGYVASMDRKSFKDSLIIYAVLIVCISITIAIKLWFADRLAVALRDSLVSKIQTDYLHDNSFNDLLLRDAYVDNPDGRITQDIQNWTTSFALILRQMIQTPVLIVYYTYLVWGELNYVAILICFGFSFLSMFISYWAMRPVMKITFEFSHADASFRLAHVNLKENAEVVALSKAQNQEFKLISDRFSDVLDVQRSRANRSFPLNWVTNFFAYFGGSISYICILIYLLTHDTHLTPMELSSWVSRNAFLIISLISGLCMILNVMLEISKLCGYNYRIMELWQILADYKTEIYQYPTSLSIDFNNVTITRPTGEVLVRGLTFSVTEGESVFITGPSGAGKSSIFRVVSRIWPCNTGHVKSPRPQAKEILIFTQRPYLPPFSLYDCVTFPTISNDIDINGINDILEFLEISHLKERPEDKWQEGLSPGERQRVALARLFYNKPKFALLDEATSAIPQALEEKVFERANQLGITLVSIAHNMKIQRYHKHLLELDGFGGYRFT